MVAPSEPPTSDRPPAHWFSWWGRIRHFVLHKILRAADSPHRLALGVAMGLFIALLPLVGIQMFIAAILCHPIKGNKVVAMAMAWVSNPFTLVPIFLPCYWLGAALLGIEAIPYENFVSIFQPNEGTFIDSIYATYVAMLDIMAPLWLGCFLVATAFAVPSYFIARAGITRYRLRRYGTVDISSLTEAQLNAKVD